VDHFLLHFGSDEGLEAGLLDPGGEKLAIHGGPPLVVGLLLSRGMQRVERRVVLAGMFGGVRAKLNGDEFALLKSVLVQERQCACIIAHIDPKAAVWSEFQHGRSHTGLLQRGQRVSVPAVNERGLTEQLDIRPALIPCDKIGEVRLAVQAEGLADLAAPGKQARVLAHAGVVDHEVGAAESRVQRRIHPACPRTISTLGKRRRIPRCGSLSDAAQSDPHLRQVPLQNPQRTRRMADVANVDRVHADLRRIVFGFETPRRPGRPM
jgi:hypothetical protein